MCAVGDLAQYARDGYENCQFGYVDSPDHEAPRGGWDAKVCPGGCEVPLQPGVVVARKTTTTTVAAPAATNNDDDGRGGGAAWDAADEETTEATTKPLPPPVTEPVVTTTVPSYNRCGCAVHLGGPDDEDDLFCRINLLFFKLCYLQGPSPSACVSSVRSLALSPAGSLARLLASSLTRELSFFRS